MRAAMFERYMALIQRLGLKDVYFKQVGAPCGLQAAASGLLLGRVEVGAG
jgi:hypothetical protein